MKKLLALLALVGLFAASASAQNPIYAPQPTILTTNYITAAVASNINTVIDCRKQASIAVQITVQHDGATTSNDGFFFLRSIDGITYETTPGQLVNVAANGTTAVTITTNIPTQGVGYLKLSYITNASATANNTNCSVRSAIKISAP